MARSSPSSRERVRAQRARLRAQGLQPVQIWVPDVRAPAFKAAARKQAKAVATSRFAKADQEFVDSLGDIFAE